MFMFVSEKTFEMFFRKRSRTSSSEGEFFRR